MDSLYNIELKMPSSNQDDYRTSTYRGHVKLADLLYIPPRLELMGVCHKFPVSSVHIYHESEYAREFDWKSAESAATRSPVLRTYNHIKQFEDSRLRYVPKLSKLSSTAKSDFQHQLEPYKLPLPKIQMHKPTKEYVPQPQVIHRERPGYTKHLDTSATTSNLKHVEFVFKDLGIGNQDAITCYNWKKESVINVSEVQENMCDKYRAPACQKRKELRTLVKHVPHFGQTSTTKASFTGMVPTFNYDISHIRNLKQASTHETPKLATENMEYGRIYNSRDPHRFVP